MAERFFATFTRALIDRQRWPTRHAIFEWLEVCSNRQRRHSARGYRSPAAFEALSAGVAAAYPIPVHGTGASSVIAAGRSIDPVVWDAIA